MSREYGATHRGTGGFVILRVQCFDLTMWYSLSPVGLKDSRAILTALKTTKAVPDHAEGDHIVPLTKLWT